MSIPIHQLYPSGNTDRRSCKFDIVFFHGLQITGGDKAWEKTWVSPGAGPRGEDVCWPREWLPEDFDKIRVLSASYDADATGIFGRGNTEDVQSIGEMLALCMKQYGIGERKFVLVGHSLGGLVIKYLVSEMKRLSHMAGVSPLDIDLRKTCKSFLENLQGIVFYAVPHAGTEAVALFNYLRPLLRLSKILEDLEPFKKKMEKLSVLTVDAFNDKPMSILALMEGKKTNGQIIVPEASAMRLAGNNCLRLGDRNHSEVCKPPSKDHPSYFQLKNFLEVVLDGLSRRQSNNLTAGAAEARMIASSSTSGNVRHT